MSMRYVYGMRLRPFSIGCQPKQGLVYVDPKESYQNKRRYWSILVYDRPLTEAEMDIYGLDFLNQYNYDEEE